jgi:hypothetical protein
MSMQMLQTIPGVAKSSVRVLKGRDPERLYHKLGVLCGMRHFTEAR